jgi:L-lysine exporter family protein LysE/ArgO
MNTLLGNISLGISLAAPIGPSGIAVIQNGLRQGFPRAFLTGVGVTLADATYLLVVFFGLSRFLEIMVIKASILGLGALALFYLGYRSIRDSMGQIDLDRQVVITARSPLLVGYIVNISNPIAVVWWIGVYGSLLSETAATTSSLAAMLMSSTILIGILIWHSSMSLLTHWGKRFLNERSARAITLIAGIFLILFGVRFAYAGFLAVIG